MNFEKTINKNMFDLSTAIRDANPLAPPVIDRSKFDHHDSHDSASSSPLTSILSHPKQRLTAQFKRAITMMKQRSDTNPEGHSVSSSPSQVRMSERPLDPSMLTSLMEEPKITEPSSSINKSPLTSSSSILTNRSTTSYPIRSVSNQVLTRSNPETHHSSASIVVNMNSPSNRTPQMNSPSSRHVKQSLQQIHTSILQTINQQTLSTHSNPSATSPSSTSSTTVVTGEVAILETIL